jgi:iron complex outermembrane receptor protein
MLMKARTQKTNKWLNAPKQKVLTCTLQSAFLALSVSGHAFAQQTGPEVSKPERKGKPAAPATVDAQEDNSKADAVVNPAVLPTVVIKETRTAAGYVTTHTVSGTKPDTPLTEIPQSISIINRRELDMRGVHLNFTEALRYVPGVAVDQFGFNGTGLEYIGMRGFNVQTTGNFRDNLNQAATGIFFGAFITDPYAVERVDVLRGPTSVMFGRGDAGGIVNRITKLPSVTPIREIEIQYGNFDRKRIAADFGLVNADGTLMFRLVTTALDSDTQVHFPNTDGDRAEIRRFYIAPSLTWRPSDRTSLTVLGDILNNRSGAGAFYVATPDGMPTNTLQGDPGYTQYSTNQASVSYKIEHHFNQTWIIRQNFRFQQQDGNFRDLNRGSISDPFAPFVRDGQTLLRNAFSATERLDQTVLDTHVQAKFSTGLVNHTVRAGIDWNRVNAAGVRLAGSAPSINAFNPVYFQPVPTPTLADLDARQRLDQVGFYVQDQIKYQKWLFTLSGRHDRVSNNSEAVIRGVFPLTFQNRDSAYTGRAGVTYLFSNGVAPYVSYSQSFLPQAGLTDGAPYNPTRASQYEVGIKYQPVGTRSLFTVALFDLTKSNVLTPNPDAALPNANAFIQIGEIRSRGAEVEARAEIYRGLNLIGAFTYNDVKVTESTDVSLGKMPIRVPNLTTSGWLDYSLGALNIGWLKGFGIGGGVRYVGRVFNDDANISITPSFTLFDAVLRYDHGPWRFFINANNIFNEKYHSASSGGNFFRGTERSVIGTLKLNF